MEEVAGLDFEELLGALFVLYILGSMVMGFLRRGRRPGSGDGEGPGRPGFPQVLDLEELEERLRDLAAGRRPGEGGYASSGPGPQVEPRPDAPEPAPPAVGTAPTPPAVATVRIPAVVPAAMRPEEDWADADEWAELEDGSWSEPSALPGSGTTSGVRALPPAAASLLDRDNPWQAAFVIKEVLGPPRALNPHRGRPPF